MNSNKKLDRTLRNNIKTLTNTVLFKLNKELQQELKRRKKEYKSQRNEYDRHIEHLKLTSYQIHKRALNKPLTVEEIFFSKEGEKEIIRQIWNLPMPQNRRVYMHIVDGFSYTKISKIEKCSPSAVKQSIDIGIEKLRKIFKKF